MALCLAGGGLQAQKELEVVKPWIQYSDAPNALYHHIAEEAYGYLQQRSQTMAAIRTLPAWQQRQAWVRKTLQEAVGRFPERTSLNAQVVKRLEHDGCRVENILYESQPGLYVTAALFMPAATKPGQKLPAIVYCSGHSQTGYRAYQHVIQNLVKKGFIVFAFDPIGQGERLQYFNATTLKSDFQWPAYEHSYVGAQVFLSGRNLANYMIWDGIRAVDYLYTRPEVDTSRLGITGRSGGGTQSAYIAAFDTRLKAVAPENYITNFTRLFQSIGPQDAEQDLPQGIRRGLDMADLLLVRAPRPALMITTTQDMFPIQGAVETAAEVERMYALYGKADAFRMVTDEAPHASTQRNREALYAFFRSALHHPGPVADDSTQPFPAGDLQVTSTGQVSTALQSTSIFSLHQQTVAQQIARLQAARKDPAQHFAAMIPAAKKIAGYQEPGTGPAPQWMGRLQKQGYVIEKYLIHGEGNYVIPYLLLKPQRPTGQALLYLDPKGKLADAAPGGPLEWLVQQGLTVLAPDIVGMGEMGPGAFRGDSYIDSVSYNLWFAALLTGRSLTGVQAGDVVRLVQVLRKDSNIRSIYGLAKQQLAPVLLHAAAFTKDIQQVALLQPYSSYRLIAGEARYAIPYLHSTVPGALAAYDLPDLASCLAPRKLLLAGVTDGQGQVNPSVTDADMEVIQAAYQHQQATTQLQVLPAMDWQALLPELKKWLDK